MKPEPPSEVETLAGELSEHMQDLLDKGHSPFVVADAMIVAGASLWLEVTKSNSLARTFVAVAQRFALIESNAERGTIN